MTLQNASLSELAEELNRADIALSIGLSRKAEREWKAYRKALVAEVDRRSPVAKDDMTDAELLAKLAE